MSTYISVYHSLTSLRHLLQISKRSQCSTSDVTFLTNTWPVSVSCWWQLDPLGNSELFSFWLSAFRKVAWSSLVRIWSIRNSKQDFSASTQPDIILKAEYSLLLQNLLCKMPHLYLSFPFSQGNKELNNVKIISYFVEFSSVWLRHGPQAFSRLINIIRFQNDQKFALKGDNMAWKYFKTFLVDIIIFSTAA